VEGNTSGNMQTVTVLEDSRQRTSTFHTWRIESPRTEGLGQRVRAEKAKGLLRSLQNAGAAGNQPTKPTR